MANKKDEPVLVIIDVDVDEEELQLDDEIVKQFGEELQSAIELVVGNNIALDTRIELVNVLMSIAAQVSIDVGISDDEFLGMADFFYEEGQKTAEKDKIDISKLN